MTTYGKNDGSASESSRADVASRRHRWVEGPWIEGQKRSYCSDCGAIRVQRCDGHVYADELAEGRVIYNVTSVVFFAAIWQGGHVTEGEPNCLRPTRNRSPRRVSA